MTAERLAYHLLSVAEAEALELANAIARARSEIRVCRLCSSFDEQDPCAICEDSTRDRTRILVVEGPREVLSFEEAGWRGLYHVLRGRIAPLEGVTEQDLTIPSLLERVRRDVSEVCIATSPDLEGEATAESLKGLLAKTGARVTRIARGIPAGAGITQVQKTILQDALDGRREV